MAEPNKRRAVVGILAHVDAGKTTLSEAMLYTSGAIRSLGRVDHGTAFLDNFALERYHERFVPRSWSIVLR